MAAPRAVVLVDPDPAWPAVFAEEAARLARVLGEALIAIHHIGSTAVPGLAAKPILDLLPIVRSLEAVDGARAALEAEGYEVRGEYGMPGRRYLVRRVPHPVHAHAWLADHPAVARHLAFRDHLRAHPEVAAAYGALKRDLAARHAADREAYQDGKAGFIARIAADAMRARR